MARRLAAPAISRKTPRLELVETPTTLAVPLGARLLFAKGVPAMGRTRTFCQVSLQVTPLILLLFTVNTNCVVVTEVIATEEPLETPLMLLAALPLPVKLALGATVWLAFLAYVTVLGAAAARQGANADVADFEREPDAPAV